MGRHDFFLLLPFFLAVIGRKNTYNSCLERIPDTQVAGNVCIRDFSPRSHGRLLSKTEPEIVVREKGLPSSTVGFSRSRLLNCCPGALQGEASRGPVHRPPQMAREKHANAAHMHELRTHPAKVNAEPLINNTPYHPTPSSLTLSHCPTHSPPQLTQPRAVPLHLASPPVAPDSSAVHHRTRPSPTHYPANPDASFLTSVPSP